MHIFYFLAYEDKPKNLDDYEHIVSIELHNPSLLPSVYDTILETMIHGPCGALGPNSTCMKDGKCSKNIHMIL